MRPLASHATLVGLTRPDRTVTSWKPAWAILGGPVATRGGWPPGSSIPRFGRGVGLAADAAGAPTRVLRRAARTRSSGRRLVRPPRLGGFTVRRTPEGPGTQ